MRRPLAVASEQVQALLGRAGRVAAVAGRHDGTRAIAALGIGDNASAQVVLRLAGVEVRIGTPGVGMPEIDNRPRDRVTVGIAHHTLQKQCRRNPLFTAIVKPRLALTDRCPGHVQRAFDGARGSAHVSRIGVPGVLQQIEKMLDTKTCDQQPCLVAGTQAIEIIHRSPELIVRHLQVFDDARHLIDQTQQQLFGPRAALIAVRTADLLEKGLELGGLGNFHGHSDYLFY